MRKFYAALPCALFLLFALAFSQQGNSQVQTLRPNVYINAECNGFAEYLPEGYNTGTQTYPLLVFIEGIGETGNGSLVDLQKLYNNGPPKYIKEGTFPTSFTVNGQTHRFIIFTPQITIPIWQRYPTAAEINQIIDYAVSHYRVNTSRIYLVGISTGAGSVWNYCGSSALYSNRLAAIAPFTGTDTPTLAKSRVIASTNLPIWAFHNRYDDGVALTYTTGYTDTITMLGCNPPPKVTIFDATGHDSWYSTLGGAVPPNNTLNVYQWMLQYSRGSGPPPNQPPTANAGTDKTITLPTNSVSLTGSGSDPDGTIASYSWTKVSGGAATINSPTAASTTISGLAQGSYIFRLTVTDNAGATGSDDVTVIVNAAPNQPPTANAGTDKTITLPTNSVSLTGSGTDPDGTISAYAWTKVSGGAATINSPGAGTTTVSSLVQGSYIFRLTVTDNNGTTAFDDVNVTVNPAPNQPPTANAGTDKNITLPTNSVTLSGTGSDPDGSITAYSWTKVSGGAATINSPSAASTTVSGLAQGNYIFRLTVTDNNGATAFDDVNVVVNATPNQSPSANAGTDQNITLPTNSVTLTGSGSDPDGSIASYSWTKVTGGTASITSPGSASTSITGLSQGSYTFRLTVTDNNGATAFDDVVVNVNAAANQSPTANAGADKTITLPANSVSLTGSGTDPDGSIAAYSWTKVSGGTATINSPGSASTTVSGLAQGSYIFRLTVTDNNGATASDDVNVTVNGAANQTPSANAGPDQTITLPTNSVTLSGSGTDPDGTIASYAWSKVSGGAATINSPSAASTTVSGLAQGSYIFRLTVTDNAGATAFDDVLVTVNGATSGGSRIEAENWSAMSGVLTENCAEGTLDVGWIDNGDWMEYSVNVPTAGSYAINLRIATPNTGAQFQIKNSGGSVLATVNVPTTGGFQSWQTTSATISLAAGTQTIRLQSTTGAGWNINWLEVAGASAANQPPTANAGADKTITLPTNSVTLSGSGTDPDGTIASYAWSKVSGGAATINSPSAASTTISGLAQGSYIFRLTVTDNAGATAFDDVLVTVNGATSGGSRIEAENWSAMSGVLTENCAEGTLDVGWIDNGDWMEYSVNAPTAGSYAINLRIATPNTGAQFQIKNSGGSVLATVNVPTTGGFQSWQTTTATISLAAGTQTIRLQSTTGAGWNINWLEVAGASAANQPPTANAGADKTITLPTNSVTLSGSGTDPDGTIASYAWSKVSGGAATINSPSAASTTISGFAQGSYIFRLTVTDNQGATAFDDVLVTVNGATSGGSRIEAENWSAMSGVLTENCAEGTLDVGWIDNGDWMEYSVNVPTAGSYAINLRIATPNTGAQFQIKNSGGSVLATVNVPTTGGFQSWQTTSATISLAAGTQTIRLQSTTGAGWNINWLEVAGASAANQPPTANAGADKTITLPTNSVTLSGSGTDPDGTIASYAWSKVSGGAATINSPSAASTTVSGLAQGSYIFRLTVTDNAGATAFDDVLVTVNGATSGGSRIEAENWSAMSGVLTENCAEGTLDVGWIDNGDWMEYSVNAPTAGSYAINLRIATPNTGAQFQIKNSGGSVLATVAVPTTGGWQTWQTITTTVNLAAGTQTIRLQSTSGAGWNINWLEIAGGSFVMARRAANVMVQELATSAVAVFPNPVQDAFTLTLDQHFKGNIKVRVVNTSGAVVREYRLQKTQLRSQDRLSLGNLAPGTYFVNISTMQGTVSKQIIKQ